MVLEELYATWGHPMNTLQTLTIMVELINRLHGSQVRAWLVWFGVGTK